MDDLRPNMNLFSATWTTVQLDVKHSFDFRKRGRVYRLFTRLVLLKPSVSLAMTLLSIVFAIFRMGILAITIRR